MKYPMSKKIFPKIRRILVAKEFEISNLDLIRER
jgi:hypothetical protein